MWRSSHGFHSSLFLDLGSVTLVLAVQLCATEGSSSVAAGYEGDCTVYHLKDGDAQSSSTPTISIEESLRIYLFSESLQWSGFSIGFTDWLDKTTGMLTYHENVEDDGGFFTLTGIEERRRGEDSSRKYKDEVVKIPREVYYLQPHVWINFTVVVQKNKLKVVFTDSAIVHFTFDASNYKKAFVHMDQSHAISVTFNCMEDTGDHHSSSKIGLTIGLTLLIITVLSVAAFYILKRRRNRQLKIHLEKGQGEDIENSKSSAQNDPMENESLLQKAEDKKEDIYSTENETKSDEAVPNRISQVAGDFEATRYNNFCLEENYEKSNKTCKHAQENILTEVTFEKTTTNQEAGANNFCMSGALPFVHESSIHDEPKVRETHMESAQHLLKGDLIEGNIITTMRSKENPKKSIFNVPHTMQHNTVNSSPPSQAQIQSDNIQVLQGNKTQKKDIYNYKIQQRREMVQPSAEDNKINIIKEGFETITNTSTEAMNGESGTSLSSRKANKSQDHRDNRHPNDDANKQLANGNKKITRGLAFPINYQGADMVSHDHPQLEHLGATCKELASATKDKILEAFNLRSGNQHLINKSSTSCNFHKNIYKIPLRKQPHRTRGGTLLLYVPIERRKKAMENRIRRLIHFNKSGWISETSTNPHEEEMFCLKKINTFFRHKSSIWKYKHFHRNRRKHFSRNKPPTNNRDALHVCNLVQMRNTYLKKSGYRGQGLCKVAKFNLNIGSFINISPRWVNKRFQRTLHKKFTRKLSYGNNLDLLHMFIRLNMGKKENRIRYLLQNVRYPLQNKTWFLIRYRILYLLLNIIHHLSIRNKSNCQIYQNSLRKNTFQSMSHQSIEMKETSVEDDSAMEVNQITEDIEFDMTASKGLPSSDEEMS